MAQQTKGGWHQRECGRQSFQAEALEPRLLLSSPQVTAGGSFSWAEGNSGTTDFVFDIRRFSGHKRGSVRWRTQDVTAKAGTDYIAASGKVTFAPHQTVKHVTVKVIGDTKREYSEWFRVELYNPKGLKIGDEYAPGEGDILNDDGDPDAYIQLPTERFYAANESAGSIPFVVYKTGNPAKSVSINYTTAEYPEAPNYSARAGVDYVRTQGTLTLGRGVMSKIIRVPLIDDSVPEPNKHFKVIFYDDYSGLDHNIAASSITNLDYPPTYYIQINDDDTPTVSLDVDPYVRLDERGHPVVRFTATQPVETSLDATFNFSTENGSASADADYMPTSGTMHMDGGSVPKYIDVPVLTSDEDSPPRDFTLNITSITDGIASNTSATGQIRFDRETPTAESVISGFIHRTHLRANITLKDNFSMQASSFTRDAIFLSGPNGYRADCFARLQANLVDAAVQQFPCDFEAPGGAWDAADDGFYAINVSGVQIADVAGNKLPAGIIGQFAVVGGQLQETAR